MMKMGVETRAQAAGLETVEADSSTNPGALVVHESTFILPDRLRFKVGCTADSAGGVTLAQEVPTLTSSARMPAGSFALRLNKTKLAMTAEGMRSEEHTSELQ